MSSDEEVCSYKWKLDVKPVSDYYRVMNVKLGFDMKFLHGFNTCFVYVKNDIQPVYTYKEYTIMSCPKEKVINLTANEENTLCVYENNNFEILHFNPEKREWKSCLVVTSENNRKITDIHLLEQDSNQLLISFDNTVVKMTFYPGMKEELNLSTILHSFDSHVITYPIDITHEQIIHSGINHDHAIISITNFHIYHEKDCISTSNLYQFAACSSTNYLFILCCPSLDQVTPLTTLILHIFRLSDETLLPAITIQLPQELSITKLKVNCCNNSTCLVWSSEIPSFYLFTIQEKNVFGLNVCMPETPNFVSTHVSQSQYSLVFHVALNNAMMLFSVPFDKIQEDGIEVCLDDSKTDCNSMIPQVSSRSYCEESVATCETGCNELDSIAEIVNDDESIDHMADEGDGDDENEGDGDDENGDDETELDEDENDENEDDENEGDNDGDDGDENDGDDEQDGDDESEEENEGDNDGDDENDKDENETELDEDENDNMDSVIIEATETELSDEKDDDSETMSENENEDENENMDNVVIEATETELSEEREDDSDTMSENDDGDDNTEVIHMQDSNEENDSEYSTSSEDENEDSNTSTSSENESENEDSNTSTSSESDSENEDSNISTSSDSENEQTLNSSSSIESDSLSESESEEITSELHNQVAQEKKTSISPPTVIRPQPYIRKPRPYRPHRSRSPPRYSSSIPQNITKPTPIATPLTKPTPIATPQQKSTPFFTMPSTFSSSSHGDNSSFHFAGNLYEKLNKKLETLSSGRSTLSSFSNNTSGLDQPVINDDDDDKTNVDKVNTCESIDSNQANAFESINSYQSTPASSSLLQDSLLSSSSSLFYTTPNQSTSSTYTVHRNPINKYELQLDNVQSIKSPNLSKYLLLSDNKTQSKANETPITPDETPKEEETINILSDLEPETEPVEETEPEPEPDEEEEAGPEIIFSEEERDLLQQPEKELELLISINHMEIISTINNQIQQIINLSKNTNAHIMNKVDGAGSRITSYAKRVIRVKRSANDAVGILKDTVEHMKSYYSQVDEKVVTSCIGDCMVNQIAPSIENAFNIVLDEIEKEWFEKVDHMKQITQDIKHECGEFHNEIQKGVSVRGVSFEELIKKKKMNEIIEYVLKNPTEEIINSFLDHYDSSLLDSIEDIVMILQLANLLCDHLEKNTNSRLEVLLDIAFNDLQVEEKSHEVDELVNSIAGKIAVYQREVKKQKGAKELLKTLTNLQTFYSSI